MDTDPIMARRADIRSRHLGLARRRRVSRRRVAAGTLMATLVLLGATAPGNGTEGDAAPTARAEATSWPSALVGHGGPVKSVAVHGTQALSASFDYSVILWDVSASEPEIVQRLLGHRAAVNDAAFANGSAITASDDGAVMLWDLETGKARARHESAGEKVMAVAVSSDGARAAAAHWDNSATLYDTRTGERIAQLVGHTANVNDVAFTADGRALTASYDGTLREWTADGSTSRPLHDHGWGVNVLATVHREGAEWVVFGGLDGSLKALPLDTPAKVETLLEVERPIMALAVSADGKRIAIGDGAGEARVLNAADWSERARIARPGPVWGLAFADRDHLYLTGLDDRVFLWRAEPNAPLATAPEEFPRRFHPRGAKETDPVLARGELQFRRKCSVCHTLEPDDANRAGPTLHGVFGRQVASLPDYPYSEAMRSLDIVWDERTISALFEHGPDDYTPGSKMPMQRIVDPADRAALVAFLLERTSP